MKTFLRILATASLGILSACDPSATRPDDALAQQPTPEQLRSLDPDSLSERSFTWGGSVQAVSNLVDHTRLEVLSYPLSQRRQPITGKVAGGRFLVDMAGFLEPQEFPPGTLVTVQGRFDRLVLGKVGDADYRYPLLRGVKLDVWPSESAAERASRPSVRWSIGVGSGGGGVGVGIGF